MLVGKLLQRSGYCSISASGFTVTVAIVDVPPPVPARPDKDGPLHILLRN